MKHIIGFVSLFRRSWSVAAALSAIVMFAAPANAQISRLGSSVPLGGGAVTRGTDVGFDPVNNVYVAVGSTNSGSIRVVVTNTSAAVLQNYVLFVGNDAAGRYGQFPRVEYAPQANNGAGGQGAFLVTFHSYGRVYAQLVSYAGGVVTQPVSINDTNSWEEAGPAIAYSSISRQFLVVWQTAAFGVRARFVNTAGAPTGNVMLLANDGTGRDPSVVWNPATNEFGFGHSGFNNSGAYVRFRTVSQAGVLGLASTFGFSSGTFNTDVDVNVVTGEFVFTWAQPAGAGSSYARLSSTGSPVATGPISNVIGGTDSLSVEFNPVSQSFLAVGQHASDLEVYGRELSALGVPSGPVMALTNGGTVGSFYPRVAARESSAAQWVISYGRNFAEMAGQLVQAGWATVNGGSLLSSTTLTSPSPSTLTPAPSACVGPVPGAEWVCVNGGWVPTSSTPSFAPEPTSTPQPTPTPTPSACVGSAPVAGWVCVNGGWVPPKTMPLPALMPTPISAPGACIGQAPMAGWSCVNGGWVPPELAASWTPTPTTCAGRAPVAGWICVDGGWRPPKR